MTPIFGLFDLIRSLVVLDRAPHRARNPLLLSLSLTDLVGYVAGLAHVVVGN